MNYQSIDRKLKPILREMEQRGIRLNAPYLTEFSLELKTQILELRKEIYQDVDCEFNLDSPRRLGEILYGKLRLNPSYGAIKKNKTGYSTAAAQLEKIRDLHPAIEKILKYRGLVKLINTYLEPLPKMVDKNNRLHTAWAVDTTSGRLSSKNPNLQNIPVRTETGKRIRNGFIAEKGYLLVGADYSQIELRVAAHLSADTAMIEAFCSGRDIHQETANELGVDRRAAKIINFGILYGISAYGLNESLPNYSREEIQSFIDRYFALYPALSEYIQKTVEIAYKNGYVETMFGRRREIPELKSPIARVRAAGERIAINHPIQGTAAEIFKLAMIKISDMRHVASRCSLLLTIHDELVLECPKEETKKIARQLKNIMENIIKLLVPLRVEVKVGENWGKMKEYL